MPGLKLEKFQGIAPRVAPEQLPSMNAQTATNVKLFSGDLIPYPAPVVVDNHGLTGSEVKTLYGLYDPDTDARVFLAWDTDVDVATPAGEDDSDEQRFYYTGDGEPRVSNYTLATTGSQPFPVDYFTLGLPLPDTIPTTSAAAFTTKTTSSYARDSSGVVTIVTSTDHGLKNGAFVNVSGFTNVAGTYSQSGTTITVTITAHGLSTSSQVFLRFTSGSSVSTLFTVTTVVDANNFEVESSTSATTSGNVEWDITNLNATSIEITSLSDTSFSYFSPGFQASTTTSSDGRVDLSGETQARTYLYTWFTPWNEESIGSEPSEPLFIREGQVVTVSNLPTTGPTGKNFVRGIRLYRTLSTTSDTAFLRLATLWFPVALATAARASNVVTMTTTEPHNLSLTSVFKIGGCSDASFDIADATPASIVDDYTFTYAQTDADSAVATVTGSLFQDVSENPGTTTARYWGESSFDFTDDFAVTSLLNILDTDEFEAPPPTLSGLVTYNNDTLVGFVGNQLFFSEPREYHAWPRSYVQTIPYDIVGLAVFSGQLLVMTESYPYIVAGTDPAVLSVIRVDARFPCISKRSITNMGYGVVYSTHGGLAAYSTVAGPQLITDALHDTDTWNTLLDPSTIFAAAYRDEYLAWHSTAGFTFERLQTGGVLVDLTTDDLPTAMWYDYRSDGLFFASGIAGDVYEWDQLGQPNQQYSWVSKIVETENPLNIGAGRVDADYAATSPVWEGYTDTWETAATLWDADGGVTLKLWVDGTLVFEQALSSRALFRLPTGYKSDSFEFGLYASVRVKSAKFAETPTSLRTV